MLNCTIWLSLGNILYDYHLWLVWYECMVLLTVIFNMYRKSPHLLIFVLSDRLNIPSVVIYVGLLNGHTDRLDRPSKYSVWNYIKCAVIYVGLRRCGTCVSFVLLICGVFADEYADELRGDFRGTFSGWICCWTGIPTVLTDRLNIPFEII